MLADLPKRPPQTQFGRWRWNRRVNTLQFVERPGRGLLYEIDLDLIRTSAQCLDWIFQASNKSWLTNEDRGNLLLAMQEAVKPQATLCSWGIERGKPTKGKR